jgi:hypothetical protein
MDVDQFRQQIDQFEHRVEGDLDVDERHRLRMDCIGIERALEAHAEQLHKDANVVEALRLRVLRIRARM